MKNNIRVVIIEDDKVIRNGYHFLVSDVDGYSVPNSYGSFEEAAKNIQNDAPDVILLDIDLPGISGVEAIPRLKKLLPKANILMLTVFDSEKSVFDALCNGASGYITKNTGSASIISSIKEVYEGGGPMSANIARMVISSFQKNPDSPLSKREAQVLELIALGKSRSHIARELFIEPGTVKTHIKNIYLKLAVNSKEEALQAARSQKLI
ncbi:MAG: response regulator transcription factor [Bacteroidetes bacterium]|nr:response regulator transcription factor [Bacteroidota bacterium]